MRPGRGKALIDGVVKTSEVVRLVLHESDPAMARVLFTQVEHGHDDVRRALAHTDQRLLVGEAERRVRVELAASVARARAHLRALERGRPAISGDDARKLLKALTLTALDDRATALKAVDAFRAQLQVPDPILRRLDSLFTHDDWRQLLSAAVERGTESRLKGLLVEAIGLRTPQYRALLDGARARFARNFKTTEGWTFVNPTNNIWAPGFAALDPKNPEVALRLFVDKGAFAVNLRPNPPFAVPLLYWQDKNTRAMEDVARQVLGDDLRTFTGIVRIDDVEYWVPRAFAEAVPPVRAIHGPTLPTGSMLISLPTTIAGQLRLVPSPIQQQDVDTIVTSLLTDVGR